MGRGLKPATRRLQLLQTLFKKYRLYQQVEGCELGDLLVYTLVAVQCAKKYLREDLLGVPSSYDALDDNGESDMSRVIAERLGIEMKGELDNKLNGSSMDYVTDGDKIVEAVIIGLLGEIYFSQIKKRDETYVDEKGNVYHFPNLVTEAQQHWKTLLKSEEERISTHKFQMEEALAALDSTIESMRGEVRVEKTAARMEGAEPDIADLVAQIKVDVDQAISIRKQLEANTVMYDLIAKELDAIRADEAMAAGASPPPSTSNAPDNEHHEGATDPAASPLLAGNFIPNEHLKYSRYLPFSIIGEESYVPPTTSSNSNPSSPSTREEDTFQELEAKVAFQGKVHHAINKCKHVYFPMFMPCTYTRLFGSGSHELSSSIDGGCGAVSDSLFLEELGLAKLEKEDIDELSKMMINTRGCTYQYVDEVEKMTTDDHERLRQQKKIMRLRAVVSKLQNRWYAGRKDLMRDLRRLKFISVGSQQEIKKVKLPSTAASGKDGAVPPPLDEDAVTTNHPAPTPADIFTIVPHLDDLIKRVTLATAVAQEVLVGTASADALKKHSYIRTEVPAPSFKEVLAKSGVDDLFDDSHAENAICMALFAGSRDAMTQRKDDANAPTPQLTAERLAKLQRNEKSRQYGTGEFEDDGEEIDNMSLSHASDKNVAPRSPTSMGIQRHEGFPTSSASNNENSILTKTASFIAQTPRSRSTPSARGTHNGRLNSARRASSSGNFVDPLQSARRLQSITSLSHDGNGETKMNTARRQSIDGNDNNLTSNEGGGSCADYSSATHLVSETNFSVDGGYAATSLSAAALTLSHNTSSSVLDDHRKSCRPKSVTDAALSIMVSANPLCVFPFQESTLLKASLLHPQRSVKSATADGPNLQDINKTRYRGDGNILDIYADVVRDSKSQFVFNSNRLNTIVFEHGGDLSGLISDSDDEYESNRKYRKKHPKKKRPERSKSAASYVSPDKQSVIAGGAVGAGWLNRRASTQGPTAARKPSVCIIAEDGGNLRRESSAIHGGRRESSFGLMGDGDLRRGSVATTAHSEDNMYANKEEPTTPRSRAAARIQRKKEDAMLAHFYRHEQRVLLRQRVGLLIDPIDATNSFVKGDPRAPMCLVGISVDGSPVAGIANRVFLKDECNQVPTTTATASSPPASPPAVPPQQPESQSGDEGKAPQLPNDGAAPPASPPKRKAGITFAEGTELHEASPPRAHSATKAVFRPPPGDGISLPMRLIDQNDDHDASQEDRQQSGKHGTCVTVRVNPAGILSNPNGALSYSLHYIDGSFINFLVLNGNLIYADEAALIDGKYNEALTVLREREVSKFNRQRRASCSSSSPNRNTTSSTVDPLSHGSTGRRQSDAFAEDAEMADLGGTLSATGVNIPSLNLFKANKVKKAEELSSEEDEQENAASLKKLFDVFGNVADATMISDGFSELGHSIRREIRRLAAKYEAQGVIFNDSAWGGKYDMMILEKLLLHIVHSNTIKPEVLRTFTGSMEPFEGSTAAGAGNKVLMVAEGDVDSFFATAGSLKKWDTCAPHAFLKCLGGDVVDNAGASLFYPTPEYAKLAMERAREQAAFASLVLSADEPGVEGSSAAAKSKNAHQDPGERPPVELRVKQAEKRAEFAAFEAFTMAADASTGGDVEEGEEGDEVDDANKETTAPVAREADDDSEPLADTEGDAEEEKEDSGPGPLSPPSLVVKPNAKFSESTLLTDETKRNTNEQTAVQEDPPHLLSSLRRRRHSAVGGQSEIDAITYYDPISLPKGAIALRGHFVKSIILRRLAALVIDNEWDVPGGSPVLTSHISATYDSAGQMLTARGQGRHHTVRARIDEDKLKALQEQQAQERAEEEAAAAQQRTIEEKCCCTVS